MAPIRVALIGLSASAKTSWASDAHLPYLTSKHAQVRFKLVALLNSSLEAAQASITHYNLDPAQVTAYGDPQLLASDPNIDLVVCNTRVDHHHPTTLPSILAGKSTFIEWPLASNTNQALLLLNASQQQHPTPNHLVGLQARVSPTILTLHTLLSTNKIGTVLSSNLKAHTPGSSLSQISPGLSYFHDLSVGGNQITVAVAHTLDYVHFLLGEFTPDTSHAQTQIQFPHQKITSSPPEEQTSDVPDLLSLHGTLASTPDKPYMLPSGATLSFFYRRGPSFPSTPALDWSIYGTEGEIRLTSERGPFLQSEVTGSKVLLQVLRYEKGEVETVEVPEILEGEEWMEEEGLPRRGRNVARLYEVFAAGGEEMGRKGVCGFEGAVARHREVDAILGIKEA